MAVMLILHRCLHTPRIKRALLSTSMLNVSTKSLFFRFVQHFPTSIVLGKLQMGYLDLTCTLYLYLQFLS